MARRQGDHLRRNEVKAGIIELIIGRGGAVREPEIRELLEKKYKIVDQGNIKKHFRDLQYSSCIVKIPAKPGFANFWDVKKIENLRNIRLKFPEIQLNKYEKCLNIVLNETDYFVGSSNANRFLNQLILSTSFFDMCIKTDMETLYDKTYEIYRLGEGYDEDQRIKKQINDVYLDVMGIISADPEIWMTNFNEQIKNSLKLESNQNLLTGPLNIKLSEKAFQKILEELPSIENIGKVSSVKEWRMKIKREMSIRISEEIVKKTLKETRLDLSKISEEELKSISENASSKIFEEIFKRIIEMPEKIRSKISDIQAHYYASRLDSLFQIFEHCFQRDIFEGTASPEEIKFMQMKKENPALFDEEMDKKPNICV